MIGEKDKVDSLQLRYDTEKGIWTASFEHLEVDLQQNQAQVERLVAAERQLKAEHKESLEMKEAVIRRLQESAATSDASARRARLELQRLADDARANAEAASSAEMKEKEQALVDREQDLKRREAAMRRRAEEMRESRAENEKMERDLQARERKLGRVENARKAVVTEDRKAPITARSPRSVIGGVGSGMSGVASTPKPKITAREVLHKTLDSLALDKTKSPARTPTSSVSTDITTPPSALASGSTQSPFANHKTTRSIPRAAAARRSLKPSKRTASLEYIPRPTSLGKMPVHSPIIFTTTEINSLPPSTPSKLAASAVTPEQLDIYSDDYLTSSTKPTKAEENVAEKSPNDAPASWTDKRGYPLSDLAAQYGDPFIFSSGIEKVCALGRERLASRIASSHTSAPPTRTRSIDAFEPGRAETMAAAPLPKRIKLTVGGGESSKSTTLPDVPSVAPASSNTFNRKPSSTPRKMASGPLVEKRYSLRVAAKA